MDIFILIWLLSLHGVNTAMYFAVTRVAYGWTKTLIGLGVFYGSVALALTFVRCAKVAPEVFAPYSFAFTFGCWLFLTVAMSRRGSRQAAYFAAVLCGTHQLALGVVCHALMHHVEGPSRLLAIALMLTFGVIVVCSLLPRIRRLSQSVDWLHLNVAASILLVLVFATGFWPIWVAGGSWCGALPFVVAVLTLVSFFPVVFHLSERCQAAARLKQVESNTQFLMAELRNVRAAEEGARRVRHDARHHIAVVREMLAAGRVAETDEYLANLSEHEVFGSSGVRRWCGNPLVDALLAVAERKAAACGKRLVATADVPAALAMDEAELVALVGNLLENAVRHGAEGEVRVSVQLDRGKVFRLSVTNPVPTGFRLTNGLPTEMEGVGLSSVRQVVEKHHGVMGYDVTAGELTCKVVIGCA